MDKIPYRIPEYHKMVWGTAKNETELYFRSDKRNLIGNIITGIVSGLYTSYLFGVWSGAMMPLIVTLIGVVFGTLFGIAFFILILCGYNGLWAIPAKLYAKERIEARKRTWKDVEIVPFSFPDDSGINGVGLEIISDKPSENRSYEINRFSGKIVKIIQKGESKYQGTFDGENNIELPLLYRRGEMFSKENRTDISNRSYSKEMSSILLVAKCNGNQAIIEKNENQNIDLFIDENSPCWVTVEMKAAIDYGLLLDMEGCSIDCKLSYNKEKNKLFISDKLIRIPEYEK